MMAHVQVKRLLKKARLFEIQKVTRRVRMLQGKRGTEAQLEKNQRKAKRLTEELEIIKELNLTEVACNVVQRITGGTFTVENEYCGTDLQERAKWRLLASKPLQQGLAKIERKADTRPSLEAGSALNSDSDSEQPEEQNSEESSGSSDLERKPEPMEETDDSDVLSGSEDIMSSPSVLSRYENSIEPVRRRKLKHKTNVPEDSVVPARKRKLKAKTNIYEKSLKRFRAIGVEASTEGLTVPHAALLGAGSLFIDSLAAVPSQHGMNRGSTESRDFKKTKNRRGQRARQRLWEKTFGMGAKHVQKEQKHYHPKHKSDVPPNSSDYHRRRGTPSVQHDPKRSTISPRLPSGCDERSSKFSEELHPSRSLSEELHPSWAAARRKKRAKEGGVMEFQGQKIVFSDSD